MMRKKEIQQILGTQLRLFDSEGLSYVHHEKGRSGTSSPWEAENSYFSQLSRNRALTQNLLSEIFSLPNLDRAYQRVVSNGGMGGVDEMSVEELGPWLGTHLNSLRGSIESESYVPESVMGVQIPKASGGMRQLGIPTVKDRMIQQAIAQQLSPLYDPLFSASSYGYRPGRSAHDAVNQASNYIASGYEWVVEIDLANFFETLHHDRLMQRLSKGIGDQRVLGLIHQYLRTGLLQDGLVSQRLSGAPQGSPLSPLLSNIYLDELDKELERRGHRFCRYADDCNIYVRSERAGHRVLASIKGFIEKKLKLKVNDQKSGVRHCSQTKYLGYTILPDGGKRIADASLKRFKKKVCKITKRNRGVSFEQVILELNQMTQGWVNYYRLAEVWLPWKTLDGWIRRRLRSYRLKQCGRKFTVFKFLRKLGVEKSTAWNAILYGTQWWKLANKLACRQAMNIAWFNQEGFQSTEVCYKRVQR